MHDAPYGSTGYRSGKKDVGKEIKMFKKIILKNFRGFKNFESPLTPITIFGGKNNSGKSSLLEAILFLFSHHDPNCFFQMNFLRHMNDQPLFTSERLWEPLFYNFDTNKKLSIILENDDTINNELALQRNLTTSSNNESNVNDVKNTFIQTGTVAFNYPLQFTYFSENIAESGNYSIFNNTVNINYTSKDEKNSAKFKIVLIFKPETMMSANLLAQWFGQLVLNDKKELIIKALQVFDKNIIDVQTIVKGAFGYLYVSFVDGRKMPLSYMGDGINRMLNMLLGIMSAPDGVVLIDEMENGFHYSMYQKIWEILGKAAVENNCQLIINTHSWDLLNDAVKGLKKSNLINKLSYVRLDNQDDIIKAHIFDSGLIEFAVKSEMEVR